MWTGWTLKQQDWCPHQEEETLEVRVQWMAIHSQAEGLRRHLPGWLLDLSLPAPRVWEKPGVTVMAAGLIQPQRGKGGTRIGTPRQPVTHKAVSLLITAAGCHALCLFLVYILQCFSEGILKSFSLQKKNSLECASKTFFKAEKWDLETQTPFSLQWLN